MGANVAISDTPYTPLKTMTMRWSTGARAQLLAGHVDAMGVAARLAIFVMIVHSRTIALKYKRALSCWKG